MQCFALARGTGERCKNDAAPGSPFCEVVQHNAGNPVAPELEGELERALEATTGGEPDPGPREPVEPSSEESRGTSRAGVTAPGPDPSRGTSRAGVTTEPEPRRADFSEEPGPEPSGLEEIPEGPGPELEDVARPGPEPERDVDRLDRVSPDLFREAAREELEEDVQEEGELEGPGPGPSPAPRVSVPGPHSARQVQRIIMPGINRGLRAAGLEELEPQEESSGGEIIALWLNHYWEELDPGNPNHALGMWLVVVLGSRVAPLAVARVTGRDRADLQEPSDNGATSSSSSSPASSGPEGGGEEEPPGWLGGEIPG